MESRNLWNWVLLRAALLTNVDMKPTIEANIRTLTSMLTVTNTSLPSLGQVEDQGHDLHKDD